MNDVREVHRAEQLLIPMNLCCGHGISYGPRLTPTRLSVSIDASVLGLVQHYLLTSSLVHLRGISHSGHVPPMFFSFPLA